MQLSRRIMKKPLIFGAIVAIAGAFGVNPIQAGYNDVYSAGHGDINLSYDDTTRTLHLNYDFGSNAVINGAILGAAEDREADTITTMIGLNGLGVAPAGLPAPFGGAPLWRLPQTSTAGRPFLGVGAEEIDPGIFLNDTFTLSLVGFSRQPAGGEFILWQAGDEAAPFMNSADGFSAADTIEIVAAGHDHYVYGFTTAGTYDLIFTARGFLDVNTLLTTTQIYRFQAGDVSAVPEPGTIASMFMGLGALGLILGRTRKSRRA